MGLNRHLILIGPMGAGKTTIGRFISNQLGAELVDLDKFIEESAGASIPWIFDIEGESGFRERESAALEEVLEKPPLVLATGGGCILAEQNRKLLASSGNVVYLSVSISQQLKRTSRDRSRPLLQGVDKRAVLKKMAQTRTPLYDQVCHLQIETSGKTPKHISHIITEFISHEKEEHTHR